MCIPEPWHRGCLLIQGRFGNVPNSVIPALPDGTASPNGAYREVRILVDGKLAGSALPWAVWFTGAYNPLIWRPIPGTGALDLPRYYVDLTPWLPTLTDGKNHTVTIDVISAENDHAINPVRSTMRQYDLNIPKLTAACRTGGSAAIFRSS